MRADAREVLSRRARELAQRPVAATAVRGTLSVFFTLGGEQLAVEARWLLGVTKLGALAALPGAEPPLRGITTWRGELLTVLDVRTLLGIPTTGLTDMTRLLVMGVGRPRFGLIVDTVGDCVDLPENHIRPVSDSSRAQQYVLGVTSDARLVLDGARLLELFD